jgi:hypothetical protein
MTDIDFQKIIDMNYRVLTLLGIATSIIGDYKQLIVKNRNLSDKIKQCEWFVSAVNDVVYLNKPIPPFL